MRQVREAAAPYQTPIEAQPSRSKAVKASSATTQERRAFCGLETHWFPRTVRLNGYDLERSSDSLATGSGEGQSCGRTRAREQKLLVGEEARRQSTQGAAWAYNHDAPRSARGTSSKVGIVMVLSRMWLQLDEGLASLLLRQAMRKASREKGLFCFIMK
jgi:hypothetical protein